MSGRADERPQRGREANINAAMNEGPKSGSGKTRPNVRLLVWWIRHGVPRFAARSVEAEAGRQMASGAV